MRTLQSLRDTCQDDEIEYRSTVNSSLVYGTYYPVSTNSGGIINPITYTLLQCNTYIPKGFYLLTYNLLFQYNTSGDYGVITPSSFHNVVDYEYSAIEDVETNPIQYSFNIERTNTYLTTGYNTSEYFHLDNQKVIHITHNTKDLKIRLKTVEFDGKVEPVEVTGTSTTVQETFQLVEWTSNFNWNDTLLSNNVSVAGISPTNVDQYLVQHSLFSFTVDSGKEGSVIDVEVHYQAYASVANVDAGIAVGPLTTYINATKINLYLKDASNNNIMETSDINPNDYIGVIRLKAVVNPGTYTIFAAGATKTTLENYNNHGWTGLLISRAGTGTKTALNNLTQKSIADLRVPVFQTIDIDGSETTAGTYLSELVPKGLSNCPPITFNTDSTEAYLFRIF